MLNRHSLLRIKFLIAILAACIWFWLSLYLGEPWFRALHHEFGYTTALIIFSLIALIPGFMNMFILVSFLLEGHPEHNAPPFIEPEKYPDISILIPCYNEEKNICDTVSSVLKQKYRGKFEIIVLDDGSNDNSLKVLKENIGKHPSLTIIKNPHRGKSFALNTGIKKAKYDLVVTIDGDSHLLPNALNRIALKFLSSSPDTVAVSGSVYPMNPHETMITRIQQWDYFLGIATIKRVQCFFQGTLVAQGAFSLFRKQYIEYMGGWMDTVGEDIVLTWTMLKKGCRVLHAENAMLLTKLPTTYKAFFLQRSRWARGMIAAFRHNPEILKSWRLSTFLVYWDLLFPLIDLAYGLIFIPGVIAAFFGFTAIAGPMTLAVIPLGVLFMYAFVFKQKTLLKNNHLKIKMDIWSCIIYVLFYNALMVPACLHGYFSEIFNRPKKWGTK